MNKLAPGVMRNVLVHGAAVALAPVVAFFLLNYLGFSDVWCAIGTPIMPLDLFMIVFSVAVLMVHICPGSFIYRSFKEEVEEKTHKAD